MAKQQEGGHIWEYMPPQNIEAEQAILGCLLFGDPSTIDVLDTLGFGPTDFFRPAHEEIYLAMRSICRRGARIDAILLKDELISRGSLEEIGGVLYIMAIGDTSFTASEEYVKFYADRVMLRTAQRGLIAASIKLQALAAGDTESIDELIASAEKEVLAIAESRSKAEGDDTEGPIIEALKSLQETDRGLLFGVPALDDIIDGLLPGDLCVIGARPSIGKTALALTVGVNVSRSGKAVSLYQFEMPRYECVNRCLSMLSNVDGMKFRKGEKAMSDEEVGRVAEASRELSTFPFHMEETDGMTIGVLESRIRRAVRKRKSKLIIIDYLEEIMPDKEYGSTEREVSQIIRRLKAIAKEQKVPLLVLAQLNRNVEHRMDDTPQLSDLRGSGKIEAAADIVILLHELDDIPVYEEPANVQAGIAKARGGRRGIAMLKHHKEISLFTGEARG